MTKCKRSSGGRLAMAVAGVLSLLLLASCASSPGPREREAARLAEFEAVAGAPVDGFNFFDLQRWQLLGPQSVAVWTRVNQAWLIDVEKPCPGLEFAPSIALSSTQNRVSRRFDSVLFGHERCQISQIRPVDGQALKAARR